MSPKQHSKVTSIRGLRVASECSIKRVCEPNILKQRVYGVYELLQKVILSEFVSPIQHSKVTSIQGL